MDPAIKALLEAQAKQHAEQMKAQAESFSAILEKLTNRDAGPTATVAPALDKTELAMQTLHAKLDTFHYVPDEHSFFDTWYDRHKAVFDEAKTKDGLDDKHRITALCRRIEIAAFERLKNRCAPEAPEAKTFDEVTTILNDQFGKKVTIITERYDFIRMKIKVGEELKLFWERVNSAAHRIKFTELKIDSLAALVFVSGLSTPAYAPLQRKLLDKLQDNEKTTLNDLMKDLDVYLKTNINVKTVADQPHGSVVQAVQGKSFQNRKFKTNRGTTSNYGRSKSRDAARPSRDAARPSQQCESCNGNHTRDACRFKDAKCHYCLKTGHIATACRKKKKEQGQAQNQARTGLVSINAVNFKAKRHFVDVKINGHDAKLQLDTGADVTIVSFEFWKDVLGEPILSPSPVVAKGADGTELVVFGKLSCNIEAFGKQAQCALYVADIQADLYGLDWDNALGIDKWTPSFNRDTVPVQDSKENYYSVKIITNSAEDENARKQLQAQFPTVFEEGLGCCTKIRATVELKPNAKPIFRGARQPSHANRELVEKEIDRWVQLGVLTPVEYSKWAAPLHVTWRSNGKIRMCADFKNGLNDIIEPNLYPIPHPDHLFAKLNGGIVFTKIDLSDAYAQIEVEEESRQYLVVNTHRGLYRFNRLPFGLMSAPGIFQHIMEQMMSGLDFAAPYFDDILVISKQGEDHLEHVKAVFDRFREWNVRIKLEKCEFFKPEVRYLGKVVNENGTSPDPEKIAAIKSMPTPRNVSELRAFLGMINYYRHHIPNLQELRQPLDALTVKDIEWRWTPQHENSVQRLKDALTTDLVLAHYDPAQQLIVAADASQHGIGAVLLQKDSRCGLERPVYYVSRTLTSAERKYAQIEKEALGLVYALKKFHYYVYGRHFTLRTDHQPLLTIFGSKKGASAHSANRLQRWALIMLAYDFSIEYKKTSEFGYADALSRLINDQRSLVPDEELVIASSQARETAMRSEDDPPGNSNDKITNANDSENGNLDFIVNYAIAETPLRAFDIRNQTASDDTLQRVMELINQGWRRGKHIDKETPDVRAYAKFRGELEVQDGIILKGNRVVIPDAMRPRILVDLHEGHPGRERMKALARIHVYWPGMNAEIEDFVRKCSSCASTQRAALKVPLQPWPETSRPMERVHIDYAEKEGRNYLVFADAYSKWPEVVPTRAQTTFSTIKALDPIFARFGFPEDLVSDNGPAFRSQEFQDYCDQRGIKLLHSPPYHPQSNGQVERFVDTFKRFTDKIRFDGAAKMDEAIDTYLRNYRFSPLTAEIKETPAERFLGRLPRTRLDLLKPKFAMRNSTNEPQSKMNQRMKRDFDRHHGVRVRSFEEGEKVFVENTRYNHPSERWSKAEIIKKLVSKNNYSKVNMFTTRYRIIVNGRTRHVHANQLRKDETAEPPIPIVRNDSNAMRSEPRPILKKPSPPRTGQRSPYPQRDRRQATTLTYNRDGTTAYKAKTNCVRFAEDQPSCSREERKVSWPARRTKTNA